MNNTIDVNLDDQNVSFRQFDVNTMCKNPVIAIIGKRASGKSWLCRYLLNKVIGPNIDAGAIFCPTEKFTSFYSKCFPDLFIHEKFTNGDLTKILHRQDVMTERSCANVESFIILDDSLGMNYFRRQSITEPLMNTKHHKLSFILTMQFPLQVPVEARCNFDYVFLFREDFYSNIKRIYDHYGGMFPTFESFRRVFKTLTETENFVAMVVVYRGYSCEITDRIFWIKAEDIEEGDFIGSDSFKDYHNKHYCGYGDVDSNEDEFMYSAFVNVNKLRSANRDPTQNTARVQTQIDVPYINVDRNTDPESDNESIFSTSDSDNSDTVSL